MPPLNLEPRQNLVSRISNAARNIASTNPIILFRKFYAVFGYIITGAIYAIAFGFINWSSWPARFSLALGLFAAGAVFVALWGIVFGAYVKKLTAAWSLLCLLATTGNLVAGAVLLANYQSVAGGIVAGLGLCGAAIALFTIWGLVTGMSFEVWDRRNDH